MTIKNITFSAIILLCLLSGWTYAMGGSDDDFLHSPLKELLVLKNPHIVSFGCGKTALVEINRLNKLYNSAYSYTGIEIEKEKVQIYKISEGSSIRILAADGSDLDALLKLGLKINDFDMAIVRHPNFAVNPDAFNKIFRKVIPHLLKKKAIVVVSLYHESEKKFLLRENQDIPHQNLNSLIIDIQYDLLSEQVLDKDDPRLPLPGAAQDKFMYYLQNKCNLSLINQRQFIVDANAENEPGLMSLIEKLSGSVKQISGEETWVKIASLYIDSIASAYKRSYEICEFSHCENAFCQKRESSDMKFSACSKCHASKYCSKECQKAHWPAHKLSCR